MTARHACGSPACMSTVARLTSTAVRSAGSWARSAASSARFIHSRCSVRCPVIVIGIASADIARAARPGRRRSSGTARAISASPAEACPAWLSSRSPTYRRTSPRRPRGRPSSSRTRRRTAIACPWLRLPRAARPSLTAKRRPGRRRDARIVERLDEEIAGGGVVAERDREIRRRLDVPEPSLRSPRVLEVVGDLRERALVLPRLEPFRGLEMQEAPLGRLDCLVDDSLREHMPQDEPVGVDSRSSPRASASESARAVRRSVSPDDALEQLQRTRAPRRPLPPSSPASRPGRAAPGVRA